MLPGEPKRVSAIDEEREQNLRRQVCSLNTESKISAENKDASAFQIGRNMEEEKELTDTMGSSNFDMAGEKEVSGNVVLAKSEEKDIYCFSFNIWQGDRCRNFTYFSYDRNKLKKAYIYRLYDTPSQIGQYPKENAPAILLSQDLNNLVLLEIDGNEWKLVK